MQNQNWPAIVYRPSFQVPLFTFRENNMLVLSIQERYTEPRLGQVLDARVIGFREVDQSLIFLLNPCSFEMLENDAQMILTHLESNGGFMTLNDKSSQKISRPLLVFLRDSSKKALGGLHEGRKN